VAGGGVIGLLTAIRCVSGGHDVVLLDQSAIPSRQAASFDHHRTVRALHLDDPAATAAVIRAHHRWKALQQLLSVRFYEQVGVLNVLRPAELPAAQAVLTDAGAQARALSPAELTSRYPFLRFPAGAGGLLETQTGVLLASRLLTACAGWLGRCPSAELRPGSKVTGIRPGGTAVLLATGEVVRADAVLLAIGPWSRMLLPPQLAAQLVLRRQSMIYCRAAASSAPAWAAAPAIRSLGADGGTWLVPPVAGTPLKLSVTSACRAVAEIGSHATPRSHRSRLVRAAGAVIPGFGDEWLVGTRDCYYLSSPAAHGLMAAVLADRVVAYAACGGVSFKFAPLVAQSLAERLTGADPAPTGLYPIDGGACHLPAATVGHRQAAL
jgi:glycine/D-amino acid oxidase-like deaminating enzyme